MAPNPQDVEHLAVLIHGFWGSPENLFHVRDTLQEVHPEVHILVVKSNESNNTYDGVEVGGERVTNEIENEVAELEAAGAKLKKVSIVGYSLGGLIARYAVGLLYQSGFFEKYEPTNFCTFASPHVGVRAPKISWRTSVWNWLGGITLGSSGPQIFLVDNFRGTGRNLLSIMADPDSVFAKGLKAFPNKRVYSNTMNDRTVPFFSSYFSRINPFLDLDTVVPHFEPGQQKGLEVILDPDHPFSHQKSPRADMSVYQRITSMRSTTWKNAQLYVVLAAVLPVIIPAFLMNAAYQTIQSSQRVKHHESGKAFDLKKYRTKLMEGVKAAQEELATRGATASNPGYLPTPPPETSNLSSGTSGSEGEEDQTKRTAKLSRREHDREAAAEHNSTSEWPILALSQTQFDIINDLEKIGLKKYACHIRKVRHTHAAIIVRSPKPAFKEGKVVVRHFVDAFIA